MRCTSEHPYTIHLILYLLLFGAAAPAMGQAIATETRTRDGIQFTPQVDANGWALRVAGPKGVTHSYNASAPPPILLVSESGSVLGNGAYHYELVAIPRETEGVETRDRASFGGSFSVRNGSIALANASDSTSLSVSPPEEVTGGSGTENSANPDDPLPDAPEPPMSNDIALSDDYCIGNGCSTIGSFPVVSTLTGYLKLKGSEQPLV